MQLLLQEQQRRWQRLFHSTIDMSDEELRAALKARSAEQRFVAVYVAGQKRHFWQEDFIALLNDPNDLVRQGARRSLIILSFLVRNPGEARLIASPSPSKLPTPLARLNQPVDFGPAPNASKKMRADSAQKWSNWWATWDSKNPSNDNLVTIGTEKKPVIEAPSERLATALVQAEPRQQRNLLSQYRYGNGVQHTEALASAIVRLSGELRIEARKTLAERLSKMTDKTLATYLTDEDAEIRRAAALALAMRQSKPYVPRIIDVLSDPEPAVQRAALDALRTLTQNDFGPPAIATESEREEAQARWRDWWKKQG